MSPLRQILAALLLVAAIFVPSPARAQSMKLIRDAEIEADIRAMASPVWQAAGINPDDVRIVLIEDRRLNAFVAGGMNIFIHTGLIQATEDPLELIGVIAHETGHIAGGHLVRTKRAVENASIEAMLAMVLGVAAAVGTGDSSAGAAVISGGQHIAQRSILSFSRTQEASADQAGISFLRGAGLSPIGLYKFMQKLEGEELLPESRQTEYVRTHPLTRDRVEVMRHAVEQSRYGDRPAPADWVEMHHRVVAKLNGYLSPASALRSYRDDDSVAGRYAVAIANYRRGQVAAALAGVDALLAEEPGNPWFHELKAQILFEDGKVAQAVPQYQAAVAAAPQSGLLHQALGHALLERGEKGDLEEAVTQLTRALSTERKSPEIHRLLATAYGQLGVDSMARLHLAEEALLQGDRATAKGQANAALKGLEPNTPAWYRARDILAAADDGDAIEE